MIDSQGQLWVTDFGLARTAADAGLTMTGDMLGTLRYMSPEQALARHGLVDDRTDIYSLGVTLYELLTGMPAVNGKDREQILNAITLDEPRPPRAVDATIPRDLETIVLKAMAKSPEERYAAARELADDLRRFLDDCPVQARPPSRIQKAQKWVRRHKIIVRAAILIFVVTSVAATISSVLVWRAYQAEAEQRRMADANYERAEEQKRYARQAVDEMYTQVAEKLLSRTGLTDVERDFLQKALRYYEDFAGEETKEPTDRAARGRAYYRLGLIHWKLQEYDKSLENLRKAKPIYEDLVQEFPENPDYQFRLAKECYVPLSQLLGPRSVSEAEQFSRRAITLLEDLVASFPDKAQYRVALNMAFTRLGWNVMHYQQRDREGEPFLRQAIGVLEPLLKKQPPDSDALRRIAINCNLLTEMLHDQSRFSEMLEPIRASVRYWEKLMQDPAGEPEYEHDIPPFDWLLAAQTYMMLGDALTRAEDFSGADAALRRSRAIAEKLAADFPKVPSYPEHLTFVHEKRSLLAEAMNKPQEAQEEYRRAIEVTEKTIATFPKMPGHPAYLARLLVRAPYQRLRDPQRALQLTEQVLANWADRPDFWTQLGMAHYQLGDWKDAAARFDQAVQLSKGGDTEACYYLAMTCAKLGDRSKAKEWHQRAAESMRDEHKSKDKDLVRLKAEADAVMRSLDSSEPRSKEDSPQKE
jgi:tetratricopeptide (TPR) repeat protein